MGRGRKVARLTPRWVQTVGAMIDEKVLVYAKCETCQSRFRVDLEAIACVKGRGFSLVGTKPRCRLVDCEGRCFFLYSPGESTPSTPARRSKSSRPKTSWP